MLQLKHAAEDISVLQPGTLSALTALREAGYLGEDDQAFFDRAYRFLRSIESHLRLMNTTARHDLPSEAADLSKLAWLLDFSSGQALADEVADITHETRSRFNRLFDTAQRG